MGVGLAETHYVWVIHGTFNPPEPGKTKWYQPGNEKVTTFCDELSVRLVGTPLEGAVWRGRPPGGVFSWSGANHHWARTTAAEMLLWEIDKLVDRDPTARVHLVAHSHGGNVVLKALDYYLSSRAARANRASRTRAETAGGGPAPEPPDHRIGRVVFLGTPFLRKQWVDPLKPTWRLARWAGRTSASLLANGAWLGAGFLFLATAIQIVIIVIMLIIKSFDFFLYVSGVFASAHGIPLVPNPAPWAVPLVALWGFLVLYASADDYLARHLFFNTNVYFDATTPADLRLREPLPALVVTARFLDEALLGLSAEPFAYADLAPRVRGILETRFERYRREPRPDGWGHGVNPRVGFDAGYHPGSQAAEGLFMAARALDLTSLVALVVWGPLRALVVRPVVTRALIDVLNSSACGLPPEEVRGARIMVLDHLDIPEVFREEYLDVTEQVLSRGAGPARPADESNAAPAERYAFLRSDAALASRRANEEAGGKGAWAALAGSLDELYQRYLNGFRGEPQPGRPVPLMSRAEFEAQTARAWFAMQERLKEVTGAVELNHSLYHSNPAVIDAVAAFLIAGARGDAPDTPPAAAAAPGAEGHAAGV